MMAMRLGAMIAALVGVAGCGDGSAGPDDAQVAPPDFAVPRDLVTFDLTAPNECFDWLPGCTTKQVAPPFPLQADAQPVRYEEDHLIVRDARGALVVARPPAPPVVWIPNSSDGTVSRLDPVAIRETARYPTYTCFSLPDGNRDYCDGVKGCCSVDDWLRYQARRNGQGLPLHQHVQTSNNSPTRTTVDWNGDLFIANASLFGGQSSVTKIAANRAACIDRNGSNTIETSTDSDGDGRIQTDCNGDGRSDDIATVMNKPCTNGLPQEFYGPDDECVLWTSNTFDQQARGLALSAGTALSDGGASDVWAGGQVKGQLVRIDGTTGMQKDDTVLPLGCQPNGLVIDGDGYGWTVNAAGGPLCYFDTASSRNVGVTRNPDWGVPQGGYLALDRDEDVWLGAGAERYVPDRTGGFAAVGAGFWTQVRGVGGQGIVADSRSAGEYFVWICQGTQVVRIPASTIALGQVDQMVDSAVWPTIQMPCRGLGLDQQQNLWSASMLVTTRAVIDAAGNPTQPVVNGAPVGQNKCPAGDSCPNIGTDLYSDFTSFGYHAPDLPEGTWSLFISGCSDGAGQPATTDWRALAWQGDAPAKAKIRVKARSGDAPPIDGTWGAWTSEATASPFDLRTAGVAAKSSLQIQVTLAPDGRRSPALTNLRVSYRCP